MTRSSRKETVCQTCGALSVEYHLPFWKTSARMLIKIYQAARLSPYHPGHIGLRFSQQANQHKMRFWGVIVKDEKPGFWRVTELGRDFVEGRAKIPSYVVVCRNELIEVSPVEHYIHEIIGSIPSREFYVEQAKEQIREDNPQGRLF